MDSLSDMLDTIDDVPALPDSSPALMAALMCDDPDMDAVAELIRRDEGLTAAVLRCANSAAWGVPGRTFDVVQSVRRLGARTLIRVALQAQVGSTMMDAGGAYGLQRRAAWRGSLFGGLAAEMLAENEADRVGSIDPGLAFSTGLLRDIGKLVIDRLVEADPGRSIDPGMTDADDDAPVPTAGSFLVVERARFGADHAALGAALAARWKLPTDMIGAIAGHHEPAPPGDPDHHPLHDLVHAADTMCLWAGLSIGHDGLRYPIAEHVQRGILRSPRRVEAWIAEVWTRFTAVAGDIESRCGDQADRDGAKALALNGSLEPPASATPADDRPTATGSERSAA